MNFNYLDSIKKNIVVCFITAFLTLFIFVISTTTIPKVTNDFEYLMLCFLTLLSTLLSVYLLKHRGFIFYFILDKLWLLGFWFKFSIQKITGAEYREPIGTFHLATSNDSEILLVSIFGYIGFIGAILLAWKFTKPVSLNIQEQNEKPKLLTAIILLSITSLLCFVNLKYNILLFVLKPDILLPLKGNAVFFLLFTRGIVFLFLFYFFSQYKIRELIFGSLLVTIISVGVLSRMIIVSFFATILTYFLLEVLRGAIENFYKKFGLSVIIFIIFSYATVLLSTHTREVFLKSHANRSISQASPAEVIEDTSSVDSTLPSTVTEIKKENIDSIFINQLKTYKDLALGRWIGVEGVMAVQSFEHKGFQFFTEALFEKSYKGNSLYSQIASPTLRITEQDRIVTTSVPGPIAFFYYTGSKLFVLFAIFMCTMFFTFIEFLSSKAFKNHKAIVVFISSFIVFDFFQFGIAPLAFFRYLSFSLTAIAIFYYLNKYKNSKGSNE